MVSDLNSILVEGWVFPDAEGNLWHDHPCPDGSVDVLFNLHQVHLYTDSKGAAQSAESVFVVSLRGQPGLVTKFCGGVSVNQKVRVVGFLWGNLFDQVGSKATIVAEHLEFGPKPKG